MWFDGDYFLPAEHAKMIQELEMVFINPAWVKDESLKNISPEEAGKMVDELMSKKVHITGATLKQLLDYIEFINESILMIGNDPQGQLAKTTLKNRIELLNQEIERREKEGIKTTKLQAQDETSFAEWEYLDDSENPIRKP